MVQFLLLHRVLDMHFQMPMRQFTFVEMLFIPIVRWSLGLGEENFAIQGINGCDANRHNYKFLVASCIGSRVNCLCDLTSTFGVLLCAMHGYRPASF
jgi:hypothetical protein